ncbi:MAG: flagellar basal-body rod protein FlgG [Bdellovibrionota bacterium]|jgi:flagellar basal-body rod protein FlgG
MIRSLYTSATGMRAQETNMDVISNNLANVNTTGYKQVRANFQDLMYQYLLEPGAATSSSTISPSGLQVGLGVRTVGTQKIFTQGDLSSTGGQLDVAIEGDGFLEVEMPDGSQAYTRSGNLQLDDTGRLVTADGYPISPTITIPQDATSVTIAQDGTVSVAIPGQSASSEVGQITGVRFLNNAGLKSLGKNLYKETDASGSPTSGNFGENGLGNLSQGFLESSNVSIVTEVVNMITGQRAYEAASKGITAADDMLNTAISIKR